MSLPSASGFPRRQRLGGALGLAICLLCIARTVVPAQVDAGALLVPVPGGWEPASPPPVPFARTQLARLNPEREALLAEAAPGQPVRVLLNLFSNEQHTAVLDRLTVRSPGRLLARGRIEGFEASQVVA